MNTVTIAGHLGADPETRVTPGGQKVTTFRVAVNVRKGGKDETIWWKVTFWGDRYDKMIPYFKKGSSFIAIGEISPPYIYNDKEGRPQVSLEMTADIIKFSPFGKPDRAGQDSPQAAGNVGYSQQGHAPQPQGAQPYGNQGGFGEQSFGSPSFGSNTGSGNVPFEAGYIEDEKLPF